MSSCAPPPGEGGTEVDGKSGLSGDRMEKDVHCPCREWFCILMDI